ncbi:MAG: HD domain-containing phosphohydrolase [Pseudomonadota bacterium]
MSPETARVMLTGNADQQTAIDAVNEGDIFRFLNKPCPPDVVARTVTAGIEMYRLHTAEKDMLENTVRGSISTLTEALSLARPDIFGPISRINRLLVHLGTKLKIAEPWWLETLGMLSQVGCVTLSPETVAKVCAAEALTPEERRQFERHPEAGATLVGRIPRLEDFADAIRYQEANYDGTGVPQPGLSGKDIPAGARLLHCVLDFDRARSAGLSVVHALSRLGGNAGRYDPQVLEALTLRVVERTPSTEREVPVSELTTSMVVSRDVNTTDGSLLVCEGQQVSESIKEHLANMLESGRLAETVYIRENPEDEAEDERAA